MKGSPVQKALWKAIRLAPIFLLVCGGPVLASEPEPLFSSSRILFWPKFDVARSVSPPSGGSGGGGAMVGGDNTWTGNQIFRDNKFSITDDADTTKILNFQLSSIGTGTTATYTWPNVNGIVILSAGTQVLNTGSGQAKIINNDGYLDFGTSSDARMSFHTVNTPDTLVVEVPSSSRTILFGERPDPSSFDFAVPLQTNPTVVILSPNQNTNERIGISHDQTQGRITDLAVTSANQRPIALHGGPDVASAATITPTGNFFVVTGTTNIDAVTVMAKGTSICMMFSGVLTVGDNNGTLNLTAAFVTTANDVLCLVSDGTNWLETSRAVN